MKRLGLVLVVLLIGYAVFYDITVGTLPLLQGSKAKETAAAPNEEKETKETKEPQSDITYEERKVQGGDTVLSIVEELSEQSLPSVETVVQDFKKLNPGESPSKLRIGTTYKFPLYK